MNKLEKSLQNKTFNDILTMIYNFFNEYGAVH